MIKHIKQIFYKKHQTFNQQKQTKMEKQDKQNNFIAKINEDKTIEVSLNNKYTLKKEDNYYDTIQILVMMANQKNRNDKYHVKNKFNLSYFSSLQFVLAKCKMEDQKCMVCLEEFQIKDIEHQLANQTEYDVYMLPCSHKYHISCLISLIGQKHWAKCPVCSTIFGKMTGDQPQGTMKVILDKNMTCPGHPKGTFILNYVLNGGIRKGVPFQGTSRTGYLPDTPQGRQVKDLLQQAFDRKLIFTVGRSVTTGLDNQTVWNGIHHKTSLNGGASHFGYPDQTYLKRVKQQLAAKGVTLQSIRKKKK